jgi:hypothetical protein
LLNGYIEILAAVEKRSIRRGNEGDVSLFGMEDLPSFNCFAIFRLPSLKASHLAHLSLPRWPDKYSFILFYFTFNLLLYVADCRIFVKVLRPSLDSWSKALLKAREAQTILVKPDLVSEDTWEMHGSHGMDVLNERCEREISPGIIFIDIDSAASNTY